HTRWPRDWSSDVCSSDLLAEFAAQAVFEQKIARIPLAQRTLPGDVPGTLGIVPVIAGADAGVRVDAGNPIRLVVIAFQLELHARSEERRVGKGVGERSWR